MAADNCGWPRVSWTLGLHPAVGEEVRVYTPEYATLPVLFGAGSDHYFDAVGRGETNSFVMLTYNVYVCIWECSYRKEKKIWECSYRLRPSTLPSERVSQIESSALASRNFVARKLISVKISSRERARIV